MDGGLRHKLKAGENVVERRARACAAPGVSERLDAQHALRIGHVEEEFDYHYVLAAVDA